VVTELLLPVGASNKAVTGRALTKYRRAAL